MEATKKDIIILHITEEMTLHRADGSKEVM